MVGIVGGAAVARLLEANATIEELDISRNTIGDAGSIALIEGLSRNQRLVELDLRQCNVGSKGAERIGCMLKTNSHLERLDLQGNSITEKGFGYLAEGLSCNTTLLEMYLAYNHGIPAILQTRIGVYLAANRFLHRYRYRSRELFPVSPFLLSIMLAQVSNHPAVLYILVREHTPDLLAAASSLE
jgi:hypothetical protein